MFEPHVLELLQRKNKHYIDFKVKDLYFILSEP